MKRCTKCNRVYTDKTLNFCLDDGEWLVADEEGTTAILRESAPKGEAVTRVQLHSTDETAVMPSGIVNDDDVTKRPFDKRLLFAPVILAALVYAGFVGYRESKQDVVPINSIAVLPFENVSGDSSLDYLSDGLSETLIDKLSQLPQLKVIARTSAFKFRGPNIDPRGVGSALGVQAVVMGKIAKQGDQLIVRVELIDARDNTQLWGERYDSPSSDVMNVEQEIGQTVSNNLRLKLSGTEEQQLAKVGTSNAQAYEYYLKGLFFRAKSGSENLRMSNRFFQQATEVDPAYAFAHANLGISYLILAGNSLVDPAEALPKAEAAARRAMELDGSIAESHLALAGIFRDRWKWKDSENEYEIAIRLNPNMGEAQRRYAQLLSVLGRHDDAIARAERGRDLDPLSPRLSVYLAYTFYWARRYDEGISEAHKTLELDPSYAFAYSILGYLYTGKGQYREAIESYQKAIEMGVSGSGIQVYLANAYAGAGERDKAVEILHKLQDSTEYVSPGELSTLLAALGHRDAAFASLEKAYASRDPQLAYLKVDPAFDPLRDDPRFAALLRKVDLPD